MRNLTKELKLKIYNEYTSSGISMPTLAVRYNISISSIYRLRKEIEAEKKAKEPKEEIKPKKQVKKKDK